MTTSRSHKRTILSMGASPRGVKVAKQSFIADLSAADLERLRKVIRNVVLKTYTRPLTNYEIDRFIEGFGPDMHRRWLAQAVRHKIEA